MPTVTATAGSASANSYDTVANATTYFDERLQVSNWTGADADDMARAMIQATRWLDRMRFTGEKTSTSQALEWPRMDALDKDGYEYDTDTVPTCIKRATYELALRLLNDNASSDDTLAASGLEQFDRVKAGSVEVEINHGSRAGELPDPVRAIIRHVLVTNDLTIPLERI